jgi:hypothetical protein
MLQKVCSDNHTRQVRLWQLLQQLLRHPFPNPLVCCTHLDAQGGQDGLGVDQVLVAQVVQATVLEDLGTSLEPHGLTEGDACWE